MWHSGPAGSDERDGRLRSFTGFATAAGEQSTAAMLMLGLSLVCLRGTMSATLPALFPTQVRYGPLSIGYNLAVSLFGGTTPFVITALISVTGNDLMPAFYVMAASVVGVIAVACMRETARRPLAGSPPSVATPRRPPAWWRAGHRRRGSDARVVCPPPGGNPDAIRSTHRRRRSGADAG